MPRSVESNPSVSKRSFSSSEWLKLLLSISSWLIYLAIYVLLDQRVGPSMTALSMLPAGLVGWFWGMWGGILAGLATFPLNMVILDFVGRDGWSLMFPGGLAGTFAIVILGGLVGRLRDLKKEMEEGETSYRSLEKQFRVVTDNAPIVLFSLDAEGVFTLSEGKGLEKLNLKPGEVIGKSAFEVYKDVPQIVDDIKQALEGNEFNSTVEVSGLVFDTWYTSLKDDDEKIVGVVGMATDITGHKKVQDESMERAKEAEKLNELTVDRELKMSEMKGVLKKVQEELDNLKKAKPVVEK